jgi:hypothetical protein
MSCWPGERLDQPDSVAGQTAGSRAFVLAIIQMSPVAAGLAVVGPVIRQSGTAKGADKTCRSYGDRLWRDTFPHIAGGIRHFYPHEDLTGK